MVNGVIFALSPCLNVHVEYKWEKEKCYSHYTASWRTAWRSCSWRGREERFNAKLPRRENLQYVACVHTTCMWFAIECCVC